MREKISVYVDELFSDAALTIRNAEVQQEILQHTLDRYDDLIAAGKSEQEAYDEAVGGIGDVSELYEHKQAAEEPKKRVFPAPPTPDAVSTAPQTGRKKKLPGWAIALICVGVAAAILALMEKQKLVAEGAGAVTVAAAMFGKLPIAGKKVCCLISGGNIDVNILSRVITRGLQREGRNCLLTIALDDKPGQLLGVTQVISECGANIVGVTHERSDAAYAVTSCLLRISMETRDFAQIEEIKAKLKEQGFKLVE